MTAHLTEGQRKIVMAWAEGHRDIDPIADATGLSKATIKPFVAKLAKYSEAEFAALREVAEHPAERKPARKTLRRGPDLPTEGEETLFGMRVSAEDRTEWERRRKAEGYTSVAAWVRARCSSEATKTLRPEFRAYADQVRAAAERALAGLPPGELASLLRDLRDDAIKIARDPGTYRSGSPSS